MASKNIPTARKTDVIVQELKGEILIYDLTINKAYCLNRTSAFVYRLCDGNHSVPDISSEISKKLKKPVTEDLIWLAIDQLKQDNLLSDSQEITTKFDGLSRRQVIRKVGLASMIALPFISALVAPTAAMSQSTCANPGGAPSGTVLFNGITCTNSSTAFCATSCQTGGAALCCSGTTTLGGSCPGCTCKCA